MSGRKQRSISQAQFVAQEVLAGCRLFSFLVMAHAMAANLTGHSLEFASDGSGQFFGKIKIAPDAFAVGAIKIKHRFRMLETKPVPHAAVPGKARGVEVVQVNTQSFQSRKF